MRQYHQLSQTNTHSPIDDTSLKYLPEESPALSNPVSKPLSNRCVKPSCYTPRRQFKNNAQLSYKAVSPLDNYQTWLGRTRIQCQALIEDTHLESIAFAHWLSIPKLNLLLVFKHQYCIEAQAIFS